MDIEVNQKGYHLFKFFYEPDDKSYFLDDKVIRGFIKFNKIERVKVINFYLIYIQ